MFDTTACAITSSNLTGKAHKYTMTQLNGTLGKQQNLFEKAAKASDETLRANFLTSDLIVKSSKASFTEGLFLKQLTRSVKTLKKDKSTDATNFKHSQL